jgi:hypothetical protein
MAVCPEIGVASYRVLPLGRRLWGDLVRAVVGLLRSWWPVTLSHRRPLYRPRLGASCTATVTHVTAKSKSVLTAKEFTRYALCVNNYTIIETDSLRGIVMGTGGCQDWEHAKPAAVVNIEHPFFEGLGFTMLLAGFLLQCLSVPQPKTIAQMRAELKTDLPCAIFTSPNSS